VKIAGLRWTPYALPFATVLQTAQAAWRTREGVILQLITEDGITGAGDVAPLSTHGTAAQADCLAALDRIAPGLLGVDLDDVASMIETMLRREPRLAPLACAIDVAASDARARAAGVGIAQLWGQAAARTVRVNALVDAAACGDAAKTAERAGASGFGDIKLKVGVAGSVAAEVERVAAVRSAAPGARLRLDANGAWSESQAIETIRALEPYGIELIEQPVAPGDAAALRRVRAATGARIAADESVSDTVSVRGLIEAAAVDAIVIKLPVAGGPSRASEISALAAQAGLDVIVTSAFDSGVGVAAALQFAATLPESPYAHGLATLDLLANDLIIEGLTIENGRMPVPSGPGIGVMLDDAALARYGAGPERVVGV
jgi:o-succinylbenzoate synthase